MGAMFLRCFPVELKPTMVKIPQMVGPFRSPAHRQGKIGCKQAINPHIKNSGGPALIPEIIGSSDPVGFKYPFIGFEQPFPPDSNTEYNHAAKEDGQKDPEHRVMARGPYEPGFHLNAKGLNQRYDDSGNDSRRKPHIIEGIPLVRIVDMGT